MKVKRLPALIVIAILLAGLMIFATPGPVYGQVYKRTTHRRAQVSKVRKHKRTVHRARTAKKKAKPRRASTPY